MLSRRTFVGKRLPLTIAFTLLILAAFGAGCKGFFVDPTLTSITINPTTPQVQLGQTATLQAYGVNSNNQGSYLTSGVSWSTSDGTTVAITGACATGTCGSVIVQGVKLGTATITAASESVTNTATATVYVSISSLSIAPPSQSIAAGGTTALPYIVTAATATGNQDISSSATLTAYTSYPGGTQVSTITCTYDASGAGGAGQYCTDNGTGVTVSTNFTVVATYTGTTLVATATLNIK
jgi:hypothetical protein